MSAVKKIIRKIVPKSSIEKLEASYRLQKAKTAYTVYGKASRNTKVIAVTGTNGKTTTCSFINEVLKAGGLKTAVNTTAFSEINGKYLANKNHMTVASPWAVQKFFKQAKKAKVDWIILEVTSHALDQDRIMNVPIEIAVLTNLTQDHLDYHGTMEKYAEAKAKLLTIFKPKSVILNADDEWYEYFGRKTKSKMYEVGQSNASHQIKGLNLSAKGTDYQLISKMGSLKIHLQIVGEFNAYNSAMAATVGQLIGIDSTSIEDGLANLPVVAGRLESIIEGQDFTVLVDYAHTPDAIENVLKAARAIAKGRVAIVFGATGVGEYARDTTKRGPMGETAVKFADYIYLTDDETYLENPDSIRDAVEEGILSAGGMNKYIEIGDRYQAIKQSFLDAKPGDVIVLAGIGHQNYRAMAGKKEPWDERQVAREILKSI